MSKSLGNFFTVREISEKYDLQVLRFFMLSAHYRSPLNFSAQLMEASKNGLERLVITADNLTYRKEQGADGPMTEEEEKLFAATKAYVEKFEEAMDDDFNTADAIAAMFELVKYLNTNVNEGCTKVFAEKCQERLVKLGDILGLILVKEKELLDEDVEHLIAERQAARKAKDFARADEIRAQLLDQGIVLEDTREGVKWKRA